MAIFSDDVDSPSVAALHHLVRSPITSEMLGEQNFSVQSVDVVYQLIIYISLSISSSDAESSFSNRLSTYQLY